MFIEVAPTIHEESMLACSRNRHLQPWRPGLFNNEIGFMNRGIWGQFREVFRKFHSGLYTVLADRIEQAVPTCGVESPRDVLEAAMWHFTRLSTEAQRRIVEQWHSTGCELLYCEQDARDVFNAPLVFDDFDYIGRVEIRFDGRGQVAAVAICRKYAEQNRHSDFRRCLEQLRDKLANDPTVDRSDSLYGTIRI